MIKLDEYELLELFESEPVFIGEEEAGNYIYTKTNKFGFTLYMFISIYEHKCRLSLSYKDAMQVIELELNEVQKIKGIQDRLYIYHMNNDHPVRIGFKPGFSIQTEIA